MPGETFGIEIPIEVIDRTSAPIQQATLKLTAMEQSIVKAQAQLAKLNSTKGAPTISLRDQATATLKTIESTLMKLGRGVWNIAVNVAGNALSTLHSLFNTITSPLGLLGGAAGIGGLIAWPLTLAGNLEQTKIGFTTLLQSGEKAQAMLNTLQTFSLHAPYSFASIATIGQNLLGVGIAAEKVVPYLTAVGDAASSLGRNDEQFQSMANSFVQMSQHQFMSMGDLQPIKDQGIDILALLATQFGKTSYEMQLMIDAGYMMSSDMIPKIAAALESKFAGGLDKGSRSLQGLARSITDTFKLNLVVGWGEGLAQGLQPRLDKLVSWFTDNAATVAIWKDTFTKAGFAVSDFVMNKVDLLTKSLSDLAPKLQGIVGIDNQIKFLWTDLIVGPWDAWWSTTGKTWAKKASSDIGTTLGQGLGGTISGLLGISPTGAMSDGATIGYAFAQGFITGLGKVDLRQALMEATLHLSTNPRIVSQASLNAAAAIDRPEGGPTIAAAARLRLSGRPTVGNPSASTTKSWMQGPGSDLSTPFDGLDTQTLRLTRDFSDLALLLEDIRRRSQDPGRGGSGGSIGSWGGALGKSLPPSSGIDTGIGSGDLRAQAIAIAKAHGIDPSVFTAQINQESGFNPDALNKKSGAAGIAQLMPQFYPGVNPYDPIQALNAAATTMAGNLGIFKDPRLALAAYDAGAGNVQKYGYHIFDPAYLKADGWKGDASEPLRYVRSILGQKMGYALGGTIHEPIFGIGQATGRGYSFGESGAEDIIPRGGSRASGSGMTINGGINVTLQMTGPADPAHARAFAAAIADPLMAEIAKRAQAASFNTVAPR